MAVRGVITDFFSIDEFNKQLAIAKDGISKYIDLVKDVPAIRATMADPSNVKETFNGMKQLAEQNLKVAETTKVIVNSQRELDKAILEGKVSQQEYNKELKDEIALQNAAAGSRTEAKAAIKLLAKERDNLNTTTVEGKKRLEEINKELDRHNKFLDETSDKTERQRRNIGNYAGSAKIIVDALEKARQKVEQVTASFGPMSPEAASIRKEFEALEVITQDPRFLNVAAAVGDSRKETAFFTKQLQVMKAAGLEGSEAFRAIVLRLAELDDSMGDVRAEIKALASDTRAFDLFAGSVNFAADAFQTFAGAAILAGASEEDAAEATKTLVAIQSVANGVKGIANELTTKGTAANKAFAFIQGLVATSLDKTAAAGKRATAALGLIGIAVTVVGAIAIALTLMNKKLDESGRRAKLLKDINEDIAKSAGSEIASLQTLYTVAKNTNITIRERKKAVDELQKQYPEHFKNIKDEIILQGKAAAAYDATKLAILETANTRAIENKLSELATQELELAYKKQGLIEDKRLNDDKKRRADRQDGRDKEQRGLDQFAAISEGSQLTKDIDDVNKQLEVLGKDREFLLGRINSSGVEDPEGKKGKTPEELAKEAKARADARLQAETEIRNILFQRQADFNKEVADNENETLSARLFSLNQYVQARIEIINRSADTEKKVGDKTATELLLVEEKRRDDLIRLSHEAGKTRVEILETDIKERSKLSQDEKNNIDKLADEQLAKFKKLEDEKTKKAKEALEDKKKLAEEERKLYADLYGELTETLEVFFTAGLERQKGRIQAQIDQLDEQSAKEKEVVEQSVGSEQDKAAKIAVIDARTADRKKQLERESRRLQIEQAKFQKAASIVKIITDTASAVIATLAKTPPPAGLPLAYLTAAIGATQLAAVIATPIPKYAKGTGKEGHPGGLAIVGDGGKSEGGKLPDGTIFKTPATATVVDLPKGTQIFPDFSKMMLNASLKEIPDVRVSVPYDKTANEVRAMRKEIVKTIKDKQESHFHLPGRYDTAMRNGSSFRAYLKDNL